MNVSVCQYCKVPDEITDPWASLHEQTPLRRRWCTLLKETLREAILLTGLSMGDFDKLYTYAVENLEDLSTQFDIDASTFDDFTGQWARVFATFYQETLRAYKRLYIEGMRAATDIQTISDMKFDLSPEESTLLTAAQATTDGPKRLERV